MTAGMTRLLPIRLAWALAACSLIGGCTDYYARQLVEINTLPGKSQLALLGSGEQMLRRGRIDEHCRVTVADGTIIDVWCLSAWRNNQPAIPPAEPIKGTVILLHGVMDSKARYLGLAGRLANRGYDVVLVDHRAHGRSTGRYVTYGAQEHRDAAAVMENLLARGLIGEPFYAFGVSMGAAVAIQYASVDPRCRGVVAVAPFTDLQSIARSHVPLLGQDRLEAILARAGKIAGFDPSDASALRAARKLACPLIVVHGYLDAIVPYDHGRDILEGAGGPAKLITVPAAGHSTILLGREAWFAERIEDLAQMRSSPGGEDTELTRYDRDLESERIVADTADER